MFDPSTAPRSRAWVEVRLDRVRENALAVRRAVGPDVGLVPMVKADAYGLGLPRVVRALVDTPELRGLWAFGVATVAEGEALRQQGWAGRVLVFSPTPHGEFERAGAAGLTLCLSDLQSADLWAAVASRVGRELSFHAEVDTGMGRAGFPWAEAGAWGAKLAELARGRLRWEGIFTHFHSADEPELAATDQQWDRFRRALDALGAERARDLLVHSSNSAASMRRQAFRNDLARPGVFLYGGAVGAALLPAPVVSVRARLVLAREVPEGATVGYGATYRARRPERWGTLAIGYGDGLPRSLSPGGGEVVVRGRRVPIIGRISMDVTTVDLTDHPDAAVGDVATLIGSEAGVEITLDEVAARCGTISYEILTRLTPRLPRVYLEGDAVDGLRSPDDRNSAPSRGT